VYAAFWDGREMSLRAFDMDGTPRWNVDLGPFSSQHGPGTSPVCDNGRVYFANDQDGDSTLYAIDAHTGNIAWKARRPPFRASYAAPLVLEHDGRAKELIVASTAGITSYVPATGKENWHWTWDFHGDPLRCVGLPQYCDGALFVSSGDGDGRRSAAAVRIGGETRPKLLWQSDKRSFPYVPSAVVRDKYIYFVTDKGFACCVNVVTGEQKWMERLASGDFFASPLLIDGKVYAISDEGVCYVFAAETTYKRLGASKVGERVKATPAVADGRLYIRGEAHLFCVGIANGVRP
jgi:outer membrane protein assembly factor BamB